MSESLWYGKRRGSGKKLRSLHHELQLKLKNSIPDLTAISYSKFFDS
jgi:hypothetical protein